MTYTVKFKDDDEGWKVEALDFGTRYLEAGEPKPFMMDDVPTEGKLDGSGGQSAVDVFLTFNRFKTANFDDLDLGPYV